MPTTPTTKHEHAKKWKQSAAAGCWLVVVVVVVVVVVLLLLLLLLFGCCCISAAAAPHPTCYPSPSLAFLCFPLLFHAFPRYPFLSLASLLCVLSGTFF